MRILIPQHRHVEAPLAVDEGFQQKLNHAFFLQMLAHHRGRLLTGRGAGVGDGIDGGENFIMTAHVIIHRRDINGHQAAMRSGASAVSAITAFPPIE
jgi:hypothetical protein